MSGGGGGGGSYKTPESEIAAKKIEVQRYDLAAGYNKVFLPQYVAAAKRDLSATAAGRANADIMAKSGNSYLSNQNAFAASQAQNALANARNTAIIRATGAADTNRIQRTDAALRSLNGTAEGAAQGLLASASRESELAWQKAQHRQATNDARTAAVVGVLGSAAAVGYDMYKDGKFNGLFKGKETTQGAVDRLTKAGVHVY